MKTLSALIMISLLSGCSYMDKMTPIQHGSVVANAITTYAGLSGGATELNPLLPSSPAGAALGSVALTYGVGSVFDLNPQTLCAMKYGAAANNVAAMSDQKPEVSIPIGILVGYLMWEFCG